MRFIISLPIVWIAFDATKIRSIKKIFDNTKYDIMTRNLTRFYTKVYNVFTHSVPLSSAEAYKKFLMREKWARKKWWEERNKGSFCKLINVNAIYMAAKIQPKNMHVFHFPFHAYLSLLEWIQYQYIFLSICTGKYWEIFNK